MFIVKKLQDLPVRGWYFVRHKIDMDPPYQRRGTVWKSHAKAFLIDSIINNYDVPKLYFADFTIPVGPPKRGGYDYAVIDGKQRMLAIIDFLDDRVALNADMVFSEDPTVELAGLRYSDLRTKYPDIAAKIENFPLPVMSVITDEPARINDLFLRLNWSKNLSGPEMRNAMEGLVPVLIRKIAAHEFFRSRISFGTDRMEDHNVAAKLLLVEFRGRLVDTKKVHLDKLTQEGSGTVVDNRAIKAASEALVDEGVRTESDVARFDEAAKRALRVLDTMTTVFMPHDKLLNTQGPITVYYWLVRDLSVAERPHLRAFLVDLQRQLAVTRKASVEGRPTDRRLQLYIQLSRSTNDQTSLSMRLTILRTLLAEYQAKGELQPQLTD
jgi:hypothetical protein